MTKDRIKIITDKLQKAILTLLPDEKLEKSKIKMLKEIENKSAIDALKGKDKAKKHF